MKRKFDKIAESGFDERNLKVYMRKVNRVRRSGDWKRRDK